MQVPQGHRQMSLLPVCPSSPSHSTATSVLPKYPQGAPWERQVFTEDPRDFLQWRAQRSEAGPPALESEPDDKGMGIVSHRQGQPGAYMLHLSPRG